MSKAVLLGMDVGIRRGGKVGELFFMCLVIQCEKGRGLGNPFFLFD